MKSNESEANQNSPTLDDMILRQISDLRTRILNYDVISEVKPTNADELDLNKLPNHADILIFGPSGSGKSSLVKTFFRSLHHRRELPVELEKSLNIKGHTQNEGTTQFMPFILKQPLSENTNEEQKVERLPTQMSSRKNSGNSEMLEFFRE